MSDKPVYQLRYGTGDVEVTEEQYFRESYMRGTPRRILYPAAAYEVLQKENNSLKLGYKAKEFILQEAQKEVAKLRSFDADNKGLKECNSILTAENEALRKELEEFEAERNRRDEMRKALEAQMGISNKWQS